jgi:hypothetical protein
MSALQLEAQLGVTYKTAWLLTQSNRYAAPTSPAASG